MQIDWRRLLLALSLLAAVAVLPQPAVADSEYDQQGDALVPTGPVPWRTGPWMSADGNTLVYGAGGVINGAPVVGFYTFARSNGVWSQQGGLTAVPYAVCDMDISADGNTVVVGVAQCSTGAAGPNKGAYIFTRSNGVWSQQGGNLTGTGQVVGNCNNTEGSTVAISGDGNTALIADPGDNTCVGAVWVFARSGSVWTQQGNKLVPTGGSVSGEEYGVVMLAASYDGNTILIGSPFDTTGTGVGAVWVFTRSGGVWSQQGNKLTPPAGSEFHNYALSADGNTAIMGGWANTNSQQGNGAWVYTRSGSVWTQQINLLSLIDASVYYRIPDWISISGDGNTAVLTADNTGGGIGVVFTRSSNTWTALGQTLVGANGAGGVGVASTDGSTISMGAVVFAKSSGPYLIWDLTFSVTAGGSTTTATSTVYASLSQLTTGNSSAGTFSFNVANSNFDVVLNFSNGCSAVLTGAGNIGLIDSGTQWSGSASLSGSSQDCGSVSGSVFATAHYGSQTYMATGFQTANSNSTQFLHNGTSLQPKSNVILSDGDAINASADDTVSYTAPDGSHFRVGGNGSPAAVGFQAPSVGQTLFHMLERGLLTLLDDTSCGPNNCGVVTVCPKPEVWLVGGRCGTPAKSAAIGVRGTAYSAFLDAIGTSAPYPFSVTVTSGSVDVSQNGVDTIVSAGNTKNFTVSADGSSATHDYNNDGKSDILWRDTSGNVALWTMNGAAVTSATILANVPTAWSIVGQRDLNGDGFTDILWRDNTGNLAIWWGDGNGGIEGSYVIANVPTTWSVAGFADFDGDGKADILWRDSSGNVAIWLMNGVNIRSSVLVGNVPTSWSIVGNSGGNILWRDTSGNTALWVMNGGTVMQSILLGSVPTSWSIVGTGNFYGDGNTGILWRDNSGNVAIWLLNNNGTVASSTFVGNVPTTWSVAETGDFNGDGKSDILWRDTSGNTAVWLMNGTTVTASTVIANVPTTWTIQGAGAD